MKRALRDSRNEKSGDEGQSHTRDDQGESNWYYGKVTKSELGLQGTQMADLYTGEPGVYMARSRVYSKGMSHDP